MQKTSMVQRLHNMRRCVRALLAGTKSVNLQRDSDAIEVNRIRNDLDANICDMSLITRLNAGPSVLLPERLRLLGLDQVYLENAQNAALQNLREVCRACDSWRRCARDLARGDATVGMERYCDNAASLDALLVRTFHFENA